MECTKEVNLRFVLINGTTTPSLDNPSHVHTNSGRFSMKSATISPFLYPWLLKIFAILLLYSSTYNKHKRNLSFVIYRKCLRVTGIDALVRNSHARWQLVKRQIWSAKSVVTGDFNYFDTNFLCNSVSKCVIFLQTMSSDQFCILYFGKLIDFTLFILTKRVFSSHYKVFSMYKQ